MLCLTLALITIGTPKTTKNDDLVPFVLCGGKLGGNFVFYIIYIGYKYIRVLVKINKCVSFCLFVPT